MRKFAYLSPAAKATLGCIGSLDLGTGRDLPLPKIVIALRKQGQTIDQTVEAIEECCRAGWLVRVEQDADHPDRIALTEAARETLTLQPAE